MKTIRMGIFVMSVYAAAAAATPPPDPLGPQDELIYAPLLEAKSGEAFASLTTQNFDILKYTIDMDIDDQAKTVDAKTTVRLESLANQMTKFDLDLTSGLTVTRVTRSGLPLSFTHSDNVLTITLDQPVNKGTAVDVTVEYNGKPGSGFYFTSDGVFTSTEPSDSRNWFPCHDDPSDKADEGCELFITVRDDWYVASNGILVGRSPAPGAALEYHWVQQYPIATYLIAIACADYYPGFNQTWQGMPVNYFIYDNQISEAPIYFENQPDMLDFFSSKFGTFPFKDEKYGVAAVAMTNFGGMENQTCTFIRSSYIGPNHNGDHLLAHELAHSWWGDMVTCHTWKDLWLNEGQASYADALYFEYRDGGAAFRQQMRSYANSYFREDEQRRFPVYNPDYLWSSTVYRKGAWVMHMLRRLLGDTKFYLAWKNYATVYKYGTATTNGLQGEFENVYRGDLDWFFDQWVYKAGYPEYKYSWVKSNGGYTVTVTVEQVQEITPITPLFKCYVDLTFATRNDTEYTETVWFTGRKDTFEFTFPEEVYWVYFDKDVWLLQKNVVNIGLALDYFRARPSEGTVVVSWATSAEKDHAGFNLYRESDGAEDGVRTKLNDKLLTGRTPYRFVDKEVTPGAAYRYWLEAVDLGGHRETYGPAEVKLLTRPLAFALYQNAPNPSRGATTFAFSLPTAGPAQLTVFDLAGREVWRREGTYPEGRNEVETTFDLAPGVYLYRLAAGGNAAAGKMVIAR